MQTKTHITSIKNILPNINSILEVQCGDGYGIENCQALQDPKLFYIGVDVVDEKIFDNRQYFRHEKNKIFMTLDASNEPLPQADLIVCTGMAPYLPIANVWSLLENIRDSGAKYFAFDFYAGEGEVNSDIQIEENSKPRKRAINLSAAPFYFPQPRFLVPGDSEHFVALYDIDEVGYCMDWHNEDVSLLRKQLAERMDQDLKILENVFAENPELYQEMMVKFVELPGNDHNQKYYYEEPFKSLLDKSGTLATRNNFFRLVYKCEPEALAKDYPFINAENITHAQILAKDYIRWRFGLSLWIN